ncbi:MAG TPA: hypothetical protein VGQ33_08670 [Vicinamibacteria bacterium]|nr:hypothetical protein [Vicinamibacteria bacterium]
MKMRVFVAAAAAAIAVLLLLRTMDGPGAPERPSPIRRPQTASAVAGTASRSSPVPLRNVFEYAGGPSVVRAGSGTPAPTPPSSPPLPQPSPSPLVRLVGLLRRGGRLRAALAIVGETVVLAPGESSGGYSVVSIDEDEGVTLRGPDGSTVTLSSAQAEAR